MYKKLKNDFTLGKVRDAAPKKTPKRADMKRDMPYGPWKNRSVCKGTHLSCEAFRKKYKM
jgi:hypothetical protein